MSDNDGGPSSGDGLTIPSPDPLARKNEDAVQEDNEAEEEANTQPILASNRGRSGDPASRRAETRCEPAETQISRDIAVNGRSAKRDR